MINATKKWIFLKVSSIILIPLMIWFIINLVLIYEKDYIDIVTFFSTQPSKFLTSLLMIVAFFYSSLSISEIFEDYIHDEKIKNIANKTLHILSIIIPLITIIVLFNLNI
ncbi:MAG: succinate dehydrogenase, hydrophobic membrane anchor protein [Pelagibacterales bacterium]|nr:succinate dehydrogenase, hydrophobic membrane anchor protein [Pelagibacterales bacterium]